MKHFLRTALPMFAIVIGVAACTQAALEKYQAGAARFTAGLQTTQQVVAAVDDTISAISSTLYKQCKSIQAIGNAAVQVSPSCTKASKVIGGVNAAIQSYCQSAQVTDITSTVTASANAYVDVKTQLAAAKASCAKGG